MTEETEQDQQAGSRVAGEEGAGPYPIPASTEAERRAMLYAIVQSPTAKSSEKMSAAKELRLMEQGTDPSERGFSTWPRALIVAELERMRALTGG